MVKTRSGKRPVVIESEPPLKRICLRSSDIRDDGDDDIYTCSICLTAMAFAADQRPQWVQCTECKHVFHECCIVKYAARSGDTFDCPQCRHSYPSTVFETEALCADELVDDLVEKQDTDYVDTKTRKEPDSDDDYDSDDEYDCTDDEDSDDEDSDNEDSDNEDSDDDDSDGDYSDGDDNQDNDDDDDANDDDNRNGPPRRMLRLRS